MSHSQRFGAGSFIFLRFTTKKEKEHFPFWKRSIPCDLDGIQTHDLQNRNLTLYSAKLQGHIIYYFTIYNFHYIVTLMTYTTTAGIAMREESKRSSIPP